MFSNRRLVWLGNGAFVLAVAMTVPGCPRAGDRVPPGTQPEAAPPIRVPPPQPPPEPPPSEMDLAVEAARGAEMLGDHRAAIVQYQRAAGLTGDTTRQADIRYTLAVLHADPNNPGKDLEQARVELQRFLDSAVTHPRLREARLLAAIMDESAQVRADSEGLKIELEALKGEVAALKSKLEEKEKELAGIKKVLLQNTNKP